MLWLGTTMSYDFTPLVILVAGGALLFIGSFISKDLRHVHL
jgi:hypothetical protein